MKNTYYCVSNVIRDDLKSEAHIFTVEAETKPESTCHSTRRADYYKDYFDTLAEAEQFIEESLTENTQML